MAYGGSSNPTLPPVTDDSDSDDELEYDSDEEEEVENNSPESAYYAPISRGEKRQQAAQLGTNKVWNIQDPGKRRYKPVLHGALLQLEKRDRKARARPKHDRQSEVVVKKRKDSVKTRYRPYHDLAEIEDIINQIEDHIERLKTVVNGWQDELTVDDHLERLTALFVRMRDMYNSRWKINSAPDFYEAVNDAIELLDNGMSEPEAFIAELESSLDYLNIDVEEWREMTPSNFQAPQMPFYEPGQDQYVEFRPQGNREYKKSPLALEDKPRASSPKPSTPSHRRSQSPHSGSRTPSRTDLSTRLSSLSLNPDATASSSRTQTSNPWDLTQHRTPQNRPQRKNPFRETSI